MADDAIYPPDHALGTLMMRRQPGVRSRDAAAPKNNVIASKEIFMQPTDTQLPTAMTAPSATTG